MIPNDSQSGWPEERLYIEQLNAIYEYIQAQRAKSTEYPAILPLITSFEGWYGGLEEAYGRGIGVLDPGVYRHVIGLDDVNEAKRRREAINAILGEHIPDTQTPADAPQTPADKPPPPPLNAAIDAVVTVAVVGGLGWALIKLLTGKDK